MTKRADDIDADRLDNSRFTWTPAKIGTSDARTGPWLAPVWTVTVPAAANLLENLRSRRAELTALLEECSGHWGFEDPVSNLPEAPLPLPSGYAALLHLYGLRCSSFSVLKGARTAE